MLSNKSTDRSSILTPLLLFLTFTSPSAIAQATIAPHFEVSTVRPSSPDAQGSNLNLSPEGIRSSNLPIVFLLQFAFDLNGGSKDQIIAAPSWVSSSAFDINAKVDTETANQLNKMSTDERIARTREMVQSLLSERFGLRVHHESRDLAVLALKIATGGPKLHSAAARDPSFPGNWTGLHNPARGRTEGRDVPIATLVNALSSKPEVGGRLVVDRTGLQGKYDFTLVWTPEDIDAGTIGPSATGPSLFTALEEQLGLKLDAEKTPVDCIVIDRIEHPSPN